jgi:hypothetical protein
VVSNQLAPDASKRFVHGSDLREYVGAVSLVLDHALEAADLALDPAQSLQVPFLYRRIDRHRVSLGLCSVSGTLFVVVRVGHQQSDGPRGRPRSMSRRGFAGPDRGKAGHVFQPRTPPVKVCIPPIPMSTVDRVRGNACETPVGANGS